MVDEHVWTSDAHFASMFVRGINPMKIVHVTPKVMLTKRLRPLSQEQKESVKVVLNRARDSLDSVDALSTAGRLFFVEYPELDGVETVADRVLYSPVVLFYATPAPAKKLLPLLIQLETYCPANSPDGCLPSLPALFFPFPWVSGLSGKEVAAPEALTWLYAKMCAAHSDGQVHQLIAHLLDTHLVIETTVIATHRAIRKQHVVMQILQQHLVGTMISFLLHSECKCAHTAAGIIDCRRSMLTFSLRVLLLFPPFSTLSIILDAPLWCPTCILSLTRGRLLVLPVRMS